MQSHLTLFELASKDSDIYLYGLLFLVVLRVGSLIFEVLYLNVRGADFSCHL